MPTKAYVAPDVPGFDASTYLAANPDISTAWGQQSANSTFAQKFPTADSYSAWHYVNYGAAEIAAGQRAPLGSQGNGPQTPDQAQTSTDDLVTNLTKTTDTSVAGVKTAVDDAVKTIGDTAKGVTDQTTAATTDIGRLLGEQAGNFTNLVNQFSADFKLSQSSLLEQMQQAAADQVSSIQKAIKLANDQVGQAQKKPNYAQAVAKNKELNSSGLSSTALTGPTGISANALPLSTTSILGA